MPYPHEHACRINDPGKYDEFARVNRESASHGGKTYVVIRGKLKDNSAWEDQAYRYPKDRWQADEARSHCADHHGSFEAASDGESASADCLPCAKKKPARQVIETLLTIPWAIRPEWGRQMLAIAQRKGSPESLAAEVGDPMETTRAVTVRDGVATIPVVGPMFRYANLFTEISGATSYAQLATDFTAALGDPDVRAIVLQIDSPGGEAFGASEMADMIYNARGQKPIIAYAEGLCCSAAYWLASAADEIVAANVAVLGSIGAAMATDGAEDPTQVEFISSQSPNKRLSPLSEKGKAQYQTIVDEIAAVFIADVARNRGISDKQVMEQYGGGGEFVGRTAVKAGLADRVGTYEALHKLLAKRTHGTMTLPLMAGDRPASSTAATLAGFLHGVGLDRAIHAIHGASLITRDDAVTVVLGNSSTTIPYPSRTSRDGHSPAPIVADHQEVRSMPESTAAAPSPGATDELLKYQERVKAIANVCAAAKRPEKVVEYLASDKTVAQITAELFHDAQAEQDLEPVNVPKAAPRIRGVIDREAEQPFATLGEQLQAIAAAGTPSGLMYGAFASGVTDKRLLRITAASGGSSAVGSEGGFAVQKDFSVDLTKDVFGQDEIVKRCDTTEIGANSNGLEVVTIDETSRATGSRWGGVQLYWGKEVPDSAITAKGPKTGLWELRLGFLRGAAYMPEALLQDAAALRDVYGKAFTEEYAFVLGDAILRGTGVGQPQGIFIADCTISISKESGQTADTVVAENIQKIWARTTPSAKRSPKGAWFINTECNPQLDTLMVGTGTSGALVYMPPGGLSGQPYGTIRGKPVIEIEQASALGDLGDLFYADLGQYKLITKGGIGAQESPHVRFLYDEMTFKWTMRVNGAPKIKSAITPYKAASGATLSPFVLLAAR